MTCSISDLLSPNGGITPALMAEIEAATVRLTDDLHSVTTQIHQNPQFA
jgi:hypothetical protein